MYISRILEKEIAFTLKNRKILLLLGARQVGKTTLVEHILQSGNGKLLNMDIEIERLQILAAASLSAPEAMRNLGVKDVLVIDEAHQVPEIGRITKGWYDARVTQKIILLGSASATLLDRAAAELTGRNEKLWLTPLLFREVLAQQPWYHSEQTSTHLYQHFATPIQSLLLQRLVFGSYPEAYLVPDPAVYLTNLSTDYLLKDILTASLIRSPGDIRRLLATIAADIGTTVSVAQLATRVKLSRQTVSRYLDLLEAIFVIFPVPAYYTDPIKEVSKSFKYYFWDTGIKNALQREWVVSTNRSDINALWENWVMAEIMKQSKTFNRYEQLFFWESRNGGRMDLVVQKDNSIYPFQIAFHPDDAASSRAFMNMYGIEPRVIHPGTMLEILL